MDVVDQDELKKEIEIIEQYLHVVDDVKDVNEKCKRVNCAALYDAIAATFKLLCDLIFMCCKKDESVKV